VTPPPRIVFVHGSVGNAEATWYPQRPLADRFEVVFLTRSGYPPRDPLDRIDFEEQADEVATELRDGDHLVGHSYGGVVSLLAAARTDAKLASLTVSEPPAFGLARGNAAVEEFVGAIEGRTFETPEEYVGFFLPLVGSQLPLGNLAPALLQGARAAMAERSPVEAEIPFAELRERGFPILVVSGGHHPAFDAVCDVLVEQLGAERVVLPGAGHSLPRAPGYNEALVDFVARHS
jgi:pimeloyl-ACP methyl ester carboxylesterase